jgi:hypothetical protein
MVRNLSNAEDNEEKILQNLEKDIEDYPNSIKKYKRFGTYLPTFSTDHLKKNVYIYFSQLANRKQLSDKTLCWMADFAQNSPYSDIKENFHNEGWVCQYRKFLNGE